MTVDVNNAGKKPVKEVFNNCDIVIEKIEEEVKNYSEKLNALITRGDSGIVLSKKELKLKSVYQNYLKNYTLISKNIDAKLRCNYRL